MPDSTSPSIMARWASEESRANASAPPAARAASGSRGDRRILRMRRVDITAPREMSAGEQPCLEREAHVSRAVPQPELLLDALLVRVHRLGGDAELAADLRTVVADGNQLQHRLLAITQRLVLREVAVRMIRFGHRGLREPPGNRGADVEVAGGNDANRVDEIVVVGILAEI